MDETEQINDQIKQQAHADKIRQERQDRQQSQGLSTVMISGHGQGTSGKEAQHQHAKEVHDRRKEREARAKDPEAAKMYDRMMKFAKEAQPAWKQAGPTAAQRHTFAQPGNAPKATTVKPPNDPLPNKNKHVSRSGVEGGSITFYACVDDGMGGSTQGKVTCDATFVAS